jgi:hypothetical protein
MERTHWLLWVIVLAGAGGWLALAGGRGTAPAVAPVALATTQEAVPGSGARDTTLVAATRLTDDLREDDFPSIAVDTDGTAWAVWQSYSGRRDEIRLRRCAGGRWHTFTRVPQVSGDVYRPQVAIDGNHHVWVVWSQQVGGNWDLYARALDGQQWRPEERLTSDPLPDISHHLIADGAGNLCVVWQGFRRPAEGRGRPQSDIFLKRYDHLAGRWSAETQVSESPANDWDPAVAVDSKGNAWVAWDTYDRGNYDVCLRSVPLVGTPARATGPVIQAFATPQAEMRATVACDRQDRVWIACEVARPNWGKDQGYTVRENPFGVPLGGPRDVAVRVLANGVLREPAAAPVSAMPEGERRFLYMPHLLVDESGRIWLTVRHNNVQQVTGPQGRVQARNYCQEYLTGYDGDRWIPAQLLPNSAGRYSILSDIAAGPNNALWLAWTTDNRTRANPHKPIHDEVYAGLVRAEGAARESSLKCAGVQVFRSSGIPDLANDGGRGDLAEAFEGEGEPGEGIGTAPAPAAPGQAAQPLPAGRKLGEHAHEAEDVAKIRSYRARAGGETLQIVRGDLHRHTELSWDSGGGGDGSVPDFFRYMIDAAAMDFGALTDHNAGGDFEYWWWLTQKLTDLYHVPGAYVPLFGYERSAAYPFGHRNILHAQRGVPVVSFFTVPTLTGDRPGIGTGALLEDDTKLLYGEIGKSGGIAIPHTSATNMGTDWRDNNRQLEPVVEIFQGARTNYEYAGAPKSADPQRDAQHIQQAGYQPGGFVWNAWKRGYRLGVITSSDHGSTHMSYAMVYASRPTREGILEGIRKRHTYGATDNIILEFRMGDAFMGDEIIAGRLASLQVKVRGTNELSRVEIVRNNQFIYTAAPTGSAADLTFRDADPQKGTSYYYVRVQQADGQMAWSSPIWVTLR